MTVEKLKQRIREQRQAVEEFRDAIDLLQQPQKYEPPNLEPLTILRQKWEEAATDKERTELLRQSKSALAESERHLESLESELRAKEDKEAAAIVKLTEAADAFNRASEEQRLKAIDYLSVSREVSATIGGDIFLPLERDAKPLAIQIVGKRALLTTSPLN